MKVPINDKNIPGFLLKYNGVVVIQSLPGNEQQTGKQLYDDIIKRRCDQTSKASYFYNPTIKGDLFNVLEKICAHVMFDELMPIIHFEIHGSKDGLVLKSGESVNWEEIQGYCRFINIQMKNQLIITLATCFGSQIWQMINIAEPAPYWGYIGPKERIGVIRLMEDFTDLYDTLLAEDSWDAAVAKLKVNDSRDKYIYLHCQGIFEYHIENKLKNIPLDKKATFKRLSKKTKEQLPGLNRSQRRSQLKNSVNNFNRVVFIAKLKRTFLMLDKRKFK